MQPGPQEVFVVRHAKAGSRHRYDGPDVERPLTKSGRRQAQALADLLAPAGPRQLWTSPYRRCVQTLEPLAELLARPLHTTDRLAEGADAGGLLALVRELDAPGVLCTHGDVLEDLLVRLAQRGVPLETTEIAKGSTWVLQLDGGDVVKARYLPPPA